MRYLVGNEDQVASDYISLAMGMAEMAKCKQARYGSIIVSSDGVIIGRGFNGPPRGLENQRRCQCRAVDFHKKITDKTCCVHAEADSILDALRHNNSREIIRSTLYFAQIDEDRKLMPVEKIYCTSCSKFILHVGIAYIVFWTEKGAVKVSAEEYNDISFNYSGLMPEIKYLYT